MTTQTPVTSIMDAIAATLATITNLTVNKYDLLTEGLQNAPLCQVYCESEVFDVSTGSDRTTFQGGVRQTEFIVYVDLYARQRRDIGEDMGALYPWVDAIRAKLQMQNTKPYFGLEAIKAFRVNDGRRVVFTYGDPQIQYIGWRYQLMIRIF